MEERIAGWPAIAHSLDLVGGELEEIQGVNGEEEQVCSYALV